MLVEHEVGGKGRERWVICGSKHVQFVADTSTNLSNANCRCKN